MDRRPGGVDRDLLVVPGDAPVAEDVAVSDAAGVETESARQPRVAGFRVVHVFDVSQTGGAELPAPPVPELLTGGAPAGLIEQVGRVVASEGFTVGWAADAGAIGGANGVTDWSTMRVLVRADMDEAAQAKTLLHEAGHALLHGVEPGRSLPRPVKEVEAESVAFVAGWLCGLSSDGYTFAYVGAWAGREPGRVLAETASRVAAAAERIVAAVGSPQGRMTGLPAGSSPTSAPAAEPGLGVEW